MRIFLDTEFTGLHQNTSLISLALVADDDQIFYAEINDYDEKQLNDWLREHVVASLVGPEWEGGENVSFYHGPHAGLRIAIRAWLEQWQDEGIEIWCDVGHWDWVLFCEIFGGAMNLPRGVWYIPYDLATLMKIKGIDPDLDRTEFAMGGDMPLARTGKHNALGDALMVKAAYRKLATS